ncbi:MAG: FAD-dependent monooxygenase [Deltaproteobacteria bacterium]|nr:FAD-dependent monooxygenase [Deltaproteobacteria bacterium]
MSKKQLEIAIVGAGIGGLTAAAALLRVGVRVQVYEQASAFARVGAGIQQSPNAVRVLRELGLEPQLRRLAFYPMYWQNRDSKTGTLAHHYPLGPAAEERFGAPYLLLHRGDLHSAIASIVPRQLIHLNQRLVGLESVKDGVTLSFADGAHRTADALVGADGVHSFVREILFGTEKPRFTGRVAYRTTFPTGHLAALDIGDNTKWWGADRHIVVYFVKPNREEIYFVTSTPESQFEVESWSSHGDTETLRSAYEDFHPQVRAVLAACQQVHKWALVERDPVPRWGEDRIVLLGDACHAMTPYMAQGAAMAVEDAAVLSRCLEGIEPDCIPAALRRYELTRKERASRVQLTSSKNTWMRQRTDGDWVYGYDAWRVPLAVL